MLGWVLFLYFPHNVADVTGRIRWPVGKFARTERTQDEDGATRFGREGPYLTKESLCPQGVAIAIKSADESILAIVVAIFATTQHEVSKHEGFTWHDSGRNHAALAIHGDVGKVGASFA